MSEFQTPKDSEINNLIPSINDVSSLEPKASISFHSSPIDMDNFEELINFKNSSPLKLLFFF